MTRVWNLSADRKLYRSGSAASRPTTFTPPIPDTASRLTRLRGQSFYTTIPDPGGGGGGYTAGTEPWRLQAGESIYDNMPAGVPVVNAGAYSSSRDLGVLLRAIDGAETRSVYVQLDTGDYTINNLLNRGSSTSPNWLGFDNGQRRVMGLIGAGFDGSGEFLTRVRVSPTMVSDTTGARDFVLNAVKPNPVPVSAMYFSNTNTTTPLFFSGITFDGSLQTPYGVFTTQAQEAFKTGTAYNINRTASSPLPWKGIAIWRALPGARMQFCRFRGFSFALISAPPFECGTVDTNYCQLTTARMELDGRIPAYIDAARPRAAGGFMWNKEIDSRMIESWMHHTRRSGMASNTNTGSTTERYTFQTFQATDIANITSADPWPSEVTSFATAGFNSWNVEVVLGYFTITDGYANSNQAHINWAVPFSNGTTPYVLPDHAVIIVRGFRTDDTLNNSMLRVAVSSRPNSTGNSPIYQALLADFAGAAAKYFDIRRQDGTRLAPVKKTLYNSAVHVPATHYLMLDF